eukprot:g1762.t1
MDFMVEHEKWDLPAFNVSCFADENIKCFDDMFKISPKMRERFTDTSKYPGGPHLYDLLKRMLDSDPTKRPTAEEVLKHSWCIKGKDLEVPQIPSASSPTKEADEFSGGSGAAPSPQSLADLTSTMSIDGEETGGVATNSTGGCIIPQLPSNSKVINIDESCRHFVAVGGGTVRAFNCEWRNVKCTIDGEVTPFPSSAVIRVSDLTRGGDTPEVWIATARTGLFVYRNNSIEHVLKDVELNAVEVVNDTLVVTGGPDKLYFLDKQHDEEGGNEKKNAAAAVLRRWEWVTKVSTGQGGVIDDTIRSLHFATASGVLYIGTESGLNTFNLQTGFFGRVGADQGLPQANITTTISDTEDENRLWIGTTSGLVIWNRGADGGSFQFLNGSRWLAGSPSSSAFHISSLAPGTEAHTIVAVVAPNDGGVTWLNVQNWTLRMKANHYERILRERHDRHGLASECKFASFGGGGGVSGDGGGRSLSNGKINCTGVDSDNDGLWTSLVVAAEYFRLHTVTNESEKRDAEEAARRYFSGMVLLNEITSTDGFMARSVCSPEEWKAETCGGNHDTHDQEHWKEVSDDDAYKGWYFKDDTSSDEVVGHIFALTVASKLSPSPEDRSKASFLLTSIVKNIVDNGYVLVGPDKNPNGTTWGKWAPRYVNGWRNFSDERGLQSLQIMAMLSAASSVSSSLTMDSSWQRAAYDDLTNATNQYDENAANLKIQTPCDDNFSDDELSFLPILTLLMTIVSSPLVDPAIVDRALMRTYSIVRPERSSLWSSIYLVGNPDDIDAASIREDILWNLQTWPLEMTNYPLSNENREDLVYENGVDRFGKHSDSSHTRSPLPANERSQYRWNADPWDVSGGGGDEDAASQALGLLLHYRKSNNTGKKKMNARRLGTIEEILRRQGSGTNASFVKQQMRSACLLEILLLDSMQHLRDAPKKGRHERSLIDRADSIVRTLRDLFGISEEKEDLDSNDYARFVENSLIDISRARKINGVSTPLHFVVDHVKEGGLWLEFGVGSGTSLRILAKQCAKAHEKKVFGFDSFEGLPEDWRPCFEKGRFAQDAPPDFASSKEAASAVELVVGLFQDSLCDFLAAKPDVPVSLLHVDCDLYSSALFVLDTLLRTERIQKNTVIVFDEICNYSGFENGELRALYEVSKKYGLRYRWIAFCGGGRHKVGSGAILVTSLGNERVEGSTKVGDDDLTKPLNRPIERGLRFLDYELCGKDKFNGAETGADGRIYFIPANAHRVARVDPASDRVEWIGPDLGAQPQKWLRGYLAPNGSIYCVPCCAKNVLKIDTTVDPPRIRVEMVGSVFREGGWKWHGGCYCPDIDTIFGIPNHIDTCLRVVPPDDDVRIFGDRATIRDSTPRNDGKYKYEGGVVGTDGNVYLMPGAADRVLKIEPARKGGRGSLPTVRLIGRSFANEKKTLDKWQNGKMGDDGCIYGIPVKAEGVLRIDLKTQEVTSIYPAETGPLLGLDKYQGAAKASNGCIYCVPFMSKRVLKISPAEIASCI